MHPHERKNLETYTSKSQIFFGGVSMVVKQEILRYMHFSEGVLPVRYLGIPLTSKSLSSYDCEVLIERMTSKVTSWTSRLLSFAGRLQLIKSVLYSMKIFWGSVFMLPKKVIKEVERICRDYLWAGMLNNHRKSKVAWSTVCLPKNYGGLGLHDMGLFNISLMLKHVWSIALKADSLWVKWIHGYYLRNNDFWAMEIKAPYSWQFKKILKIRKYALKCVDYSISGIKWKGEGPAYTAATTYKSLSTFGDKKTWARLVWTKYTLPKHSFLLWIVCLNKLPTRQKLKTFGIVDDDSCPICNSAIESREHLLFECDFCCQIWESAMRFIQVQNCPSSWPNVLDWMLKKWKGNSTVASVKKAAAAACIYNLWMYRNTIIFQQKRRSKEEIIEQVIYDIKILCSKIEKLKDTAANREWCSAMKIYPVFVSTKS